MSDPLFGARRVVIKVGSALLVDAETGALRREWLETLREDISDLRGNSTQVIIVSSGAIALGRGVLKERLGPGPLSLEEKQAAAAVGQGVLAEAYSDIFKNHHITAQVLLTLGDTEERDRYLNARATLKTLLDKLWVIPVINENDTVATAEIRYGDNDRLAARVASMMEADVLVLLSDIDGLYTADPNRDLNARHIDRVTAITREIEAMAGDSISGVGRGGMAAKIVAAKIATAAGCDVVIAKGKENYPLKSMRHGARHTVFTSSSTPAAARKRWIAGTLKPQGTLIVDSGAVNALIKGKSLLPAGVRQIEGRFERGDAVSIRDQNGHEVARGLVAYNVSDAERIAGKKSAEIEAILGYRGRDEMVHRDDLAMLEKA